MSSSKKEIDHRFEKFGTISFTKQTKVNAFVDWLEAGKIMTTQCAACGAVFFPPRADCCHCLANDMQWIEVTGQGRLVSFSWLQFAPVGFENDLPYCIAIQDYGDFQVFGRIDSRIDISEVQIGMPMITTVNRLANGQLSYVFTKA